jgi:septum formation protein
MLRDAGLDIEVRGSRLDEDEAKREFGLCTPTPRRMAQYLASAKAKAVEAAVDEWVLGADQTLELDGELVEKPGSLDGLKVQLERLQGREHRLYSAAALVQGGELVWEGCSSARMVMRRLGDNDIRSYVAEEGPNVLACVGGYRLEGPGVQLFDAVEGEYFAVLGLPLLDLLAGMRRLGILS